MSLGTVISSRGGQWLSCRREYEVEDLEWEQFYRLNKANVPLLLGTVENLRQLMFNAKMRGESKTERITNGLVVKDHVISTESANVKLRTYTPDDHHRDDKGFPTMIYFHGGGFALGDLEGEDRTCRILCIHAGLVIVSVDYRLQSAPEHPYPAALNDAWDALDWIVQNATELHVDQNKILTGGNSAGANLAAVLAQGAKQRGITIRAQLLRIPVLCQSDPHYTNLGLNSMNELHDAAILTPSSMRQFMQWYQPSDPAHVTVSPLLASKFGDLPPAYLQLCGRDPLRDEGLAYADALHDAGVPVRVNVYSGLPHAFWIFPEISTTQVATKDLIEGVKWLLAKT